MNAKYLSYAVQWGEPKEEKQTWWEEKKKKLIQLQFITELLLKFRLLQIWNRDPEV